MFKNLFSRKGKDTKQKWGGVFALAPATSGEAEAADEEFQLLSLHSRRVEEQLRREFDLTPSKSGTYL